jgi:hypothetical protein
VKGYLLPTKLHPANDTLSPIHKDRLTRSEDHGKIIPGVQDVNDVLVLICGHGGRDIRCGILGPLLREEFERQLPRDGFQVLKEAVNIGGSQQLDLLEAKNTSSNRTARVGLISHIGGHKYAGNVILYIPPGAKTADGRKSELAGCGIWYGRVEPKHIEGIVKETILGGRVIADLFRGGIRQGGEILRL